MHELLECPICASVCDHIIETPCCHKCYCENCLNSWLSRSTNCPECRATISISDCRTNYPLQRVIDGLPIACTYEPKGCTGKVTRGTFHAHIERCDYSPAVCHHGGLKCVDILKKDLPGHLESCIFRPISCPKCESNLLFFQLEEHYANVCIECPSPCEDCKIEFLRKHLCEHSKTCPEKILQCSYSPRGCTFMGKLNQRNEHMEIDIAHHLELVCAVLEAAEIENTTLKGKISTLEQQLAQQKRTPNGLVSQNVPSFFKNLPRSDRLIVDSTGLGITSKSGLYSMLKDAPPAAMVYANVPIPATQQYFYFEITIHSAGRDGSIGLGLATIDHNFMGMPGWSGGFGYHGDDGRKFSDENKGKGTEYGPTFGRDDTVGIGYDQAKRVVFFTKNGLHLGDAFKDVQGSFYPVIGANTYGVKISVNFGAEPFKYNKITH